MSRPISIQQQHALPAPRQMQRRPGAKHSRAHHRHIANFRSAHRINLDFFSADPCELCAGVYPDLVGALSFFLLYFLATAASFSAQCAKLVNDSVSVGSRCNGVTLTSPANTAA